MDDRRSRQDFSRSCGTSRSVEAVIWFSQGEDAAWNRSYMNGRTDNGSYDVKVWALGVVDIDATRGRMQAEAPNTLVIQAVDVIRNIFRLCKFHNPNSSC